jgi:chromosome segregation ATPase
MIKKLYNLKKKELDQLLIQKARLLSQLLDIDKQMEEIYDELIHVSVDKFGAISDFVMLSIHKNYLKEELNKLNYRKSNIQKNIDELNQDIIQLNKECEQYDYINKQFLKERLKEIERKERLIVEDFVQAKYIKEKV